MGASAQKKDKKSAREEREHKLILKHKFENRITIARSGRQSYLSGDFVGALKKYNEYFDTMAEVNNCPTKYDLTPGHFHKTKDITEMLMLSHLYFEMAKIYDASGKFHDDVNRCLEQFVLFSANQPYQVLNSELLRKHLRKFKFRNHDKFFSSYQQIFVQSKKCYVVTFCFSDDHPTTHHYRELKDWLLEHDLGQKIVSLYYRTSSEIVPFIETRPLLSKISKTIIAPSLQLFSRYILPLIIRR